MGPCLCGDICCPSCGPAQGNSRCPACRAWASEGCECTEAQVQAAMEAERQADIAYAEEVMRMDREATEYWKGQ